MEFKLKVAFYCNDNKTEPVREWLGRLTKHDKRIIGEDIKTIQYGWPLGMPLVRSVGDQLWEIRSKLSGGRIARIIFFMDTNTLILVNGFIKKTHKTPNAELDLAKDRKKRYQQK
jgi:phage-related protein